MQILHPEDAKVLGCPEGVKNCEGLPVVRGVDNNLVSFWQPDLTEIEVLQRGGSIFLSVKGPHPLVSIGVSEYPETTATETDDEALERAAERHDGEDNYLFEQAAFKAGARWQKSRPVSIKFRPLEWINPEPHIHACQDEATLQTFVLSEHEGVVYFGTHPVEEFKTDKTIEGLKEELQTVRNSRLMSVLDIEALVS